MLHEKCLISEYIRLKILFDKSFGFIVARRSAAVGALGVD